MLSSEPGAGPGVSVLQRDSWVPVTPVDGAKDAGEGSKGAQHKEGHRVKECACERAEVLKERVRVAWGRMLALDLPAWV